MPNSLDEGGMAITDNGGLRPNLGDDVSPSAPEMAVMAIPPIIVIVYRDIKKFLSQHFFAEDPHQQRCWSFPCSARPIRPPW